MEKRRKNDASRKFSEQRPQLVTMMGEMIDWLSRGGDGHHGAFVSV
jgi:hypothetical protein